MNEIIDNKPHRYRPEIDGLRALAVLPVILFHAGYSLFGGGYIGVDVFFVISGYLITTIILNDINRGSFSIKNFYERRARRILPALFFIMLVTIPFAWVWMPVPSYQDFMKSVGSVVFFFSNVFFLLQSGYFDVAAEHQPLLHTWSLSIEEQYYLFFPFFVITLVKLSRKTIGESNSIYYSIIFLICVSFVLSEIGHRFWSTANFYLLSSRAWELLVGSCCAIACLKQRNKDNGLLAVVGLVLIIGSIFYYDESTPFPSFYTLAPVAGTALIILYSDKEGIVGGILANRLFVSVGVISYSIYLWHQPLFALARIRYDAQPGSLSLFLLAMLSVFFAYVTWRFIEKPFRYKMTSNIFFIFILATAIILFALCISEIIQAKFNWSRFQPIVYNSKIINVKEEQQKSWDEFLKNPHLEEKLSYFTKKNNEKLLILGDSHAKDLFNALYSTLDENTFEVRHSNLASRCTSRINNRFNPVSSDECLKILENNTGQLLVSADIVILTRRWVIDQKLRSYLPELIEVLKERGIKVLLAGNTVEYTPNAPVILERLFKSNALTKEIASRELYGARDSKVFEVNEYLREIATKTGIVFLDKADFICDDKLRVCDSLDKNEEALYFDYGHHTIAGARHFGEKMLQLNWLQMIPK